MKAHIISPFLQEGQTQLVNFVIPFETLEVSIALDNGAGGKSKFCFRDDVRVFSTKEDSKDVEITEEVIGKANQYGTTTIELIEILNKAQKADLNRK